MRADLNSFTDLIINFNEANNAIISLKKQNEDGVSNKLNIAKLSICGINPSGT